MFNGVFLMRFVVCGAPCSGKSTYVIENAKAGDLIYDYDALQMALSGQGSHQHINEIRPYVVAARDAVFEQFESHVSQAAWIITSSPKAKVIDDLAARFDALVKYLPVSQEEAHERAKLDSRPDEWHDYIDNWFENTDFDSENFRSESKMNKKTYKASFKLKEDGEPGEVIAVFATLNKKDHHADVTIPGAFREQEVIIEPWNHSWELPAGKGVIRSNDTEAYFEGAFFMETEAGRENYLTVKSMGDLAEWSYTFDIEESRRGEFEGDEVQFLEKLDVVGVSPVTRGAGIGTRTVFIKSEPDDQGESEEGKPSDYHKTLIDLIELTVKKNTLEV